MRILLSLEKEVTKLFISHVVKQKETVENIMWYVGWCELLLYLILAFSPGASNLLGGGLGNAGL